jgi:hypothetical protein
VPNALNAEEIDHLKQFLAKSPLTQESSQNGKCIITITSSELVIISFP